MPLKKLRSRVNYDNHQYEVGDVVDIRAECLAQLQAVDAIEDPPACPTPDPEDDILGGERSPKSIPTARKITR